MLEPHAREVVFLLVALKALMSHPQHSPPLHLGPSKDFHRVGGRFDEDGTVDCPQRPMHVGGRHRRGVEGEHGGAFFISRKVGPLPLGLGPRAPPNRKQKQTVF